MFDLILLLLYSQIYDHEWKRIYSVIHGANRISPESDEHTSAYMYLSCSNLVYERIVRDRGNTGSDTLTYSQLTTNQ
jgi:hypothetical protein